MLKRTKIRDLTTAWLEEGPPNVEGDVFLFLHGCPDTPFTWKHQLDRFSTSARCIAPFARGIGESEGSRDSKRYSLDAIALDHLEILRESGESRDQSIIVVGHDLGGPQAWNIAHLLGRRLKALITINGPAAYQMAHRAKNLRQLAKSWYAGFFQIPVISDSLIRWKEKDLIRLSHRVGEKALVEENASIVKFLPQYREGFKTLVRIYPAKPAKIEAPVLVLAGSRDPFLELPKADELKPLASQVTIRVLEGGHWIHESMPKKVNQLIEGFLGKIKEKKDEA
ncbi:MAG: alpha/beta fold hydrolase [Bdellovibrionota bacterium]